MNDIKSQHKYTPQFIIKNIKQLSSVLDKNDNDSIEIMNSLLRSVPHPTKSIPVNSLLCDAAARLNDYQRAYDFGKSCLKIHDQNFIRQKQFVEMREVENDTDIYSYSLFGSSPEYFVPLIESISQLRKLKNNGYTVVVYHDDSVPQQFLEILEINSVVLKKEARSIGLEGTFWRFKALDDYPTGTVHFRDADSVITSREIKILEWVKENFPGCSYLIRDHVQHNHCILAGLFGLKHRPTISVSDLLARFPQKSERIFDQLFLGFFFWPWMKTNSLQIDRFYRNTFEGSKYINPDIIDKLLDERLHIGSKIYSPAIYSAWVANRLPNLTLNCSKRLIESLGDIIP